MELKLIEKRIQALGSRESGRAGNSDEGARRTERPGAQSIVLRVEQAKARNTMERRIEKGWLVHRELRRKSVVSDFKTPTEAQIYLDKIGGKNKG